jgi:hypothetical protein
MEESLQDQILQEQSQLIPQSYRQIQGVRRHSFDRFEEAFLSAKRVKKGTV